MCGMTVSDEQMTSPSTRTGNRKVLVVAAIVVVALPVLLTGCGGDHADQAQVLRDRLKGMDGVVSVDADYESGELPFDPGTASFEVIVDSRATTDEVVDVVDTAYAQFHTSFRHIHADIGLEVGDSHIAVHTYKPHAEAAAVSAAARYALHARRDGETLQVDINARDEDDLEDKLGDLFGDIELDLGPDSRVGQVLPRLADFRSNPGLPARFDIGVLAADGGGLGGSRGLPSAHDVAVWRQLSQVSLPGNRAATIRVQYGPYQFYSSMRDFGFAAVTVRSHGAPITPAQLKSLRRAQSRILAANHRTFVYTGTVNGHDSWWLRRNTDTT